MARKKYSRLQRIEEQKDIRSAIIFGILAIVLMILVIAYGLPAIAKFAGLLADLNQSDSPVEIFDQTPPAPPSFRDIPEYTDKTNISFEGTAEAGTTVTASFNSKTKETIADDSGQFEVSFSLLKGENELFAYTVDSSGNKSTNSKVYTIIYDVTPPELTISSPSDGQSFLGNDSPITVSGNTDFTSTVTVNERYASVNEDGAFTTNIGLNEGENTLEIVATDQAGNETSITLTVNYAR